jgi:DNA-binding CsgD family transcriptional regulator
VTNKFYRSENGTWHLSPRQLEILIWAAKGKTYTETGMILGISHGSIHTHVRMMQVKLNAVNIAHAVAIAYELGIIPRKTVEPVPFYRIPEELVNLKENTL